MTSQLPLFEGTPTTAVGKTEGDARISSCGTYRYDLWRRWNGPGSRMMAWVMLNPSTADGKTDDHTIRRCIYYTRAFGFEGFRVANLFAYRTPHPSQLPLDYAAAVGPETDAELEAIDARYGLVVAAWGNDGERFRRDLIAGAILARRHAVYALARTKSGQPGHPGRLANDTRPTLWLPKAI